MRYPNRRILELYNIIKPYLKKKKLDTNEPIIPLYKIKTKNLLVDNAPKEIISAVEEWKILSKKQDEEDAKYNYIFV